MSAPPPTPVELDALLDAFVARGGSDLYLSVGSRPSMRLGNALNPLSEIPLTRADVERLAAALLPEPARALFREKLEYNSALEWKEGARFRVNMYQQRQQPGIVLRRIVTNIPTLEELHLPPVYGQLAMERRGLVLVVGPTSSGKSTSLAAMIGHRNLYGSGHIVTVEDPIEFLHEPVNCIVSQRDVGIDTLSMEEALKNALRQSPDVIMIGEIRDAESMEHALTFAETGHLVFATVHANNSHQTIERIVHFFPEEKRSQILMNLSLNLRGVLSQRLIGVSRTKRILAVEIMLNQGLIRQLIFEGKIRELRDCIEKGRSEGMQSFDQALFDLVQKGEVTPEVAIAEADSAPNLRLRLKQQQVMDKAAEKTPGAIGSIKPPAAR